MEKMISVEHLTRDYGEKKGVFDISFSMDKGEVFGFLGPNGAGKTTVIRHLMGFIKPKTGTCMIKQRDCWKDRDIVQEIVGYIPGEISFFDDMSGMEYLNFIEKYRRLDCKNRKRELIDLFELDTKMKIRKMSKGNKQKVAIVAAFMHDPQVLILDEPTSGLDPLMQNRFVQVIKEEKKKGKTIFLSSHIFEEVERTCDRIAIIRDGALAAVDEVDTLRKKHLRTYQVQLNSEEEAIAFARDFDGNCDGCLVTVSAKTSLEDIFMNYYGGNGND